MKKNKGFTLIELLAVIVILAVIALIATPIIMNVINDAKKGAATDAMYGYVKAVELASAASFDANNVPNGTYQTQNGNLKKDSETLNINFKGTKPKDGGEVVLNYGTVTSATLEFNGFEVRYDGKEAIIGAGAPTEPAKTYEIGEVVYYDPTGAVNDCASGKEWTPSNTETTCYKWNVVKDNGNSIEMLLDHNLPTKMAWVTQEDFLAAGGLEENYVSSGTKYGPITVLNQLKVDTASWSNVETLTSSDNVTRNDGKETYTIDYSGMKARLIGAKEIADLDGNTSWQPDGEDIALTSATWLKQNLSLDNTDTEPWGYWTDLGRVKEIGASGWNVFFQDDKSLHKAGISAATFMGIRPITRVLKSNLS